LADAMIRTGAVGTLLLAAVLASAACDPSEPQGADDFHRPQAGGEVPSDVVVWGCERATPSKVKELDPSWREEATLAGDFGFGVTAGDFSAWRPHRRADFQFKLPVTIEGHSAATVWIRREEWSRASLILSDVTRRGPGNSYRVEDGHRGIRFDPCVDRQWTAWVAGLALSDPRELDLMVEVEDARRPMRVTLGPWTTDTID
jgi:hypothetical protein